jgi:hypothetical protein
MALEIPRRYKFKVTYLRNELQPIIKKNKKGKKVIVGYTTAMLDGEPMRMQKVKTVRVDYTSGKENAMEAATAIPELMDRTPELEGRDPEILDIELLKVITVPDHLLSDENEI